MYLVDALRVLLRRWKIVVVGLFLLVLAAMAVVRWVPTQYQATGQLFLLLPPEATGAKTPTNPYLNVQDGLTTTSSLIAGSVTTKDTQNAVQKAGFTSEYSVGLNPGSGPLIIITAKDTDPDEALATRDEVMRLLESQLASIQKDVDVPAGQMITARPTSVDTTAQAQPGSKMRAMAAATAVVVLLTLIVAFTRDGAIQRRRWAEQRAKPRRDAAPEPRRTSGERGGAPQRRPAKKPTPAAYQAPENRADHLSRTQVEAAAHDSESAEGPSRVPPERPATQRSRSRGRGPRPVGDPRRERSPSLRGTGEGDAASGT